MKISINKFLFSLIIIGGIMSLSHCTIEDIDDPNGPSIAGVVENASKSELQLLVTGIESSLRKEVSYYYDVTSIIGRDYWYFTNSDPRWTGEILGKNESTLDNRGFYGTRPYSGRYKTVKTANILLEAVANSRADLSDEDKKGYAGFAKTIQAYELLLVLNLQYENGIRVDVKDPNNLGAFLSYDESLAAIQGLLEQAVTDLGGSGATFTFTLSSGFDGFDTPASFTKFNRAIAARVAMYQNDKASVLTKLSGSFLDMDGDFMMGIYRTYSTAGGEEVNPIYKVPNQSEADVAHPAWVTALATGDDRSSKVSARIDAITLDGLTGGYDVSIYASNTASIPLIRNEELILLSAEANIGTDNATAKAAINKIRTTHGLGNFSGSTDAELLDEVLAQRRFSLFGEGHRWVDLRRHNRLDQISTDRAGDDVWTQFPRPGSEN